MLTIPRVHRQTSIGGHFHGHHPLIALPWGWGTTWGGGIKGWGKVTRSGLLGTPDLETFDIKRNNAPSGWGIRAARCRVSVV